MSLDIFVLKVPDFDSLSPSEQIPYFVYYLTNSNEEFTSSSAIKECFDSLCLAPYSNIHSFLSRKSKGKDVLFLKNKYGVKLNRKTHVEIAEKINEQILLPVSNNLVPLEIFNNTPYYIVENAKQMCRCYDLGLYDACLVMMRKLVETLIIECFERFNASSEIKNPAGHFLYLSDLIPIFMQSTKWNPSRNLENTIKQVKKYGDLSSHNRRFLAKKNDIDDFKFDLRQCLEEIILIINYKNWNGVSVVSS